VPFWIYIVGVGIAFSRGFIDGSAIIEMVHISFLVRALYGDVFWQMARRDLFPIVEHYKTAKSYLDVHTINLNAKQCRATVPSPNDGTILLHALYMNSYCTW
jgi:hypothetical protein